MGDQEESDAATAAAAKKQAAVRMRQLTYPVMTRVAIGVSALAVNSATNMSFPWIMGRAIDIVSGDESGHRDLATVYFSMPVLLPCIHDVFVSSLHIISHLLHILRLKCRFFNCIQKKTHSLCIYGYRDILCRIPRIMGTCVLFGYIN